MNTDLIFITKSLKNNVILMPIFFHRELFLMGCEDIMIGSNQNHPIQEEEQIVPLKGKNNPPNLVWVDAYQIGQINEVHTSHRHHYHLKYFLHGAERNSIKLQVLNDRLRLMAQKSDKEWYYSEYLFKYSLKPEQSHTQFRDGVLLVDIPFDCGDQYRWVEPLPIN